jgi:hypothetical protein
VLRATAGAAIKHLYYLLRPGLPVPVRKHIQRLRLSGWDQIPFPRWPVDVTVEVLMERTLRLLLEGAQHSIPFIWFWPDAAETCVVMTHDVEGPPGAAFCGRLMDLDEEFGVPAAFQLVPDAGGCNVRQLASEIRRRGFEVNLHDLNHDGYLFHSRHEFLRRAARINMYARELGCRGFRAGAMYRKQHWFSALDVSYDMSVPNAAHLEPQRGGCCTVMPFFVGDILELPLTTVQDYSLFHVLGEYSIDLWKRQIEEIAARNGLIMFITHPDYLIESRAREVYVQLLGHLADRRARGGMWFARPGEVDRWWRSRARMSLVADRDGWRIEGRDSERARVAYATLREGRVAYSFESAAA